ncbi:MAG: hypothetical protein HN576_13255 [Bacteriovoracaceae bacterium]|jgi:hypothetical protein|nr:hypothetical protein [Bacteriovoracaceae bacterium]
MKKDESYNKLVKKLKKSKSERKDFIKRVDRIKDCQKNISKLDPKKSKGLANSTGKLISMFNEAIKESK